MNGYRIAKGLRNIVRVICLTGIVVSLACATIGKPSEETCKKFATAAAKVLEDEGKEKASAYIKLFVPAACGLYADALVKDDGTAEVPVD